MERILQVVTYMGRGGIESMLMNYYRCMDRTQLQFDFLVHREFRADFDDEIETMGGRIYRIPPMNPASHSYRKALADFFRQHSYRVVHCHLNYMSGIILHAAKKVGIPVRIAHAHTANMAPGWKQVVRRLCKYLIPVTATHLFSCSTDAGKAVFGSWRFSILANAIDTESFTPNGVFRDQMRIELKLDEAFTVMHIGRMIYAKNHEFLLNTFEEVLAIKPDTKLVIVGDGELRSEIEARVSEFPKGSVMLLGTRTDISNLLQAADVFVFPSHFEGLPVTLIEAQAAGLPCIKSDNVTNEAVVTNLVTSLPLGDPKLWAEEILKKRGIPSTDQSQAIIDSGYDIHTAAKKLENFYLNGEPL